MIIAKSRKDLDKMREVGELIAEVRETLRAMVEPGISTLELNRTAEKMMRISARRPHFSVITDFRFPSAHRSTNKCSRFSSDKTAREGDIVSLDMAAKYNGFVGRHAFTGSRRRSQRRIKTINPSRRRMFGFGNRAVYPDKRVGDISWAVQQHAEKYGYGIVRDYTGHGIGRSMHEAPQIANYGRPGTKKRFARDIVSLSSRC
jgi:methionyl aminopeptidase